jgi:tRNA(Met) C34 N-acetyltransferase TmcA
MSELKAVDLDVTECEEHDGREMHYCNACLDERERAAYLRALEDVYNVAMKAAYRNDPQDVQRITIGRLAREISALEARAKEGK